MHTDPQLQVGPLQRRFQEALGGRDAQPPPLVDLEIADAFALAIVEIIDLGNAERGGGAGEIVENVPFQALLFDPQFPARAVIFAVAVEIILGFQEIGQHIVQAQPAQPS